MTAYYKHTAYYSLITPTITSRVCSKLLYLLYYYYNNNNIKYNVIRVIREW